MIIDKDNKDRNTRFLLNKWSIRNVNVVENVKT